MNNNLHEAFKWLKQAERDLKSAGNSVSTSDFNWACFQAQQSAEKALKSVLYARGYRKILTHSVFDLIKKTGKSDESFLNLRKEARVLDGYYMSTRYPDSIVSDLTPSEYFEEEDAEECIRCAELILRKAKEVLKA
ncbi:HEPN domain-containing protein [Methanoplanus endosymbiosus]|uniref:HEPN domain-containing protein n=1 Tax=Methanoplanus endosymbiosus TaxID=33865 RepID=A0A9E7PL76_9EURY|nr:HEPN domain-containing protein [Methanoplanus endosymbiosus]UUX92209.1 HEPN domain-containing protein [Methanoplanus endosymbiosus]